MNKLLISTVIAFSLVLFIFVSCSRRVNCPQINQDWLTWYPYDQTDTIVLSNSSDDSLDLIQINDNEISNTNFWICSTMNEQEFYRIDNSSFNTYTLQNDFNFEGTIISQVKIFENNTGNGLYKKLIVGKNYGILSLTDIRDKVWILRTSQTKNSGTSGHSLQKSGTANYKLIEEGC